MGRCSHILFARLGGDVPDASYAILLHELERALVERPTGVRLGLFFDLQEVKKANAVRRQQMAEITLRHEALVAQPGSAIAIVTRSALMRGLVRAVCWVSKPPCPTTIETDPGAAMDFLGEKLGGVDTPRFLEVYRQMVYKSAAVRREVMSGGPPTG